MLEEELARVCKEQELAELRQNAADDFPEEGDPDIGGSEEEWGYEPNFLRDAAILAEHTDEQLFAGEEIFGDDLESSDPQIETYGSETWGVYDIPETTNAAFTESRVREQLDVHYHYHDGDELSADHLRYFLTEIPNGALAARMAAIAGKCVAKAEHRRFHEHRGVTLTFGRA